MRIFHELAVDEVLGDANYAKFQWEAVMGNVETLRIVVVAESVSGTNPTFSLSMYESPDLSSDMNLMTTLVNAAPLMPGQANVMAVSVSNADSFMPASYAYRLYFALGGTSPSARVRIWVTGRGKA